MIFGIVPLFDFKELIDNIYINSKVNLSNLRYDKLVVKSVNAGFKHIEITSDFHYVLPGTFSKDILDNLKRIARSHEISYSVHLPLWSLELASPNRFIREASVTVILDAINYFEKLEPTNYVIHLWGALSTEFSKLKGPSEAKEIVNRFIQSYAAESLDKIIEESGIDPKLIAVENVEFPWDLTFELVKEYETSICYDTGHLVSGQPGNLDPIEFLTKYFDNIIELHLHDGKPGVGEDNVGFRDHMPLGHGVLPVCELLSKLIERKFDGPIVFELSLDNALRSIEYIKKNCDIEVDIII